MKRALRSVAWIAAISVFIGWAAFLAGSEERTERLPPALEQKLQQLRPGEKVAVVVELAEQAHLSQVISKMPKASRWAKAQAVVEALRSVADQTQPLLSGTTSKSSGPPAPRSGSSPTGSSTGSSSEGALLGLAGTLIGVVLSLAAVYALNVWPVHFTFGRDQQLVLAPALAAGDALLIGAIVVVMAILASLQPAWKAARMDPITALRHV